MTAARRATKAGGSREATRRLCELLTDALGAPVIDRTRGLNRWPCPVCGGGDDETGLFPYRPLVLADDGRVWCDAALDRGYGPPTCNFTLAKLTRVLREVA